MNFLYVQTKGLKSMLFKILKKVRLQIKACLLIWCFNQSLLFGENTEIKNTFEKASEEERAQLEQFSSDFLAGTVCGYVLYGDKPVGWVNLQAMTSVYPLTIDYQVSLSVLNGLKMWKKLGLPLSSKNYILHIHEDSKEVFSYLLCINRKAFDEVFHKNELLFKYILGPEITADALLNKITDPREDFCQVIKDDVVLIGILLGFGAENAMYTSRLELILAPSKEDTPSSKIEPSFGYLSLKEESADILQKIHVASQVLDEQLPVICFGCDPTKKESQDLVSHYEATQLKIIEVLESGAIFENLIEQFFDEKIDRTNRIKQSYWQENSNLAALDDSKGISCLKGCGIPIDWASLVAHLFRGFFIDNIDDKEEALSSFIEGMRDADQSENVFMIDTMWNDIRSKQAFSPNIFYYHGFKAWSHYKCASPLYSLNDVIKAINRIEGFNQIPKEGHSILYKCHILLHEYLYQQKQQIENTKAEAILKAKYKNRPLSSRHEGWFYEPKIPGLGELVQENEPVELQFFIKNVFGLNNLLYGDQLKKIPLAHAMRGFKEGLTGIRRGCAGTLYIHPDYGFRSVSHFFGVRPFLIVDVEIQ